MYIWTIFLRPIQSGQNKTNHYPDVNAISNESPSQEMAEVTHSPHLSLESLKKATSSHGTLEKGTTKNIIGESLQHPPPQKKTYPSRHFDSTRFCNLTTLQSPPCWQLCRWSDFQEFPPDELLQHHNLSSQPDFVQSMRVRSDEFDRWFVDDGHLSKPELSYIRFPPRRRWVQLKLPANLWKSMQGQQSIRTYKRNTLYIPFSLSRAASLYCMFSFSQNRKLLAGSLLLALPSLNPKEIYKYKRNIWKTQVLIETKLRLGFLGPGWVFKTFGFFKTTCANSYTYLTL